MTQTNISHQTLPYWRGTHALVIGIISIASIPVVSIVLGIIAIVYGHRSRQSFDQVATSQQCPTHPKTGQPVCRGLATAGWVLGIIAVPLGVIYAVVVISLGIWGAP